MEWLGFIIVFHSCLSYLSHSFTGLLFFWEASLTWPQSLNHKLSKTLFFWCVWYILAEWCMSLVTRKPVFGVCDHGRLKPACEATETRQRLEILDIETWGIILSRQRTIKALIRLRGCAGWSALLLFAYGKSQVFSWRGSNNLEHDKINKLVCAPSKYAKSLDIQPVWSTNAQADLSLCWVHTSFCCFCHALPPFFSCY